MLWAFSWGEVARWRGYTLYRCGECGGRAWRMCLKAGESSVGGTGFFGNRRSRPVTGRSVPAVVIRQKQPARRRTITSPTIRTS